MENNVLNDKNNVNSSENAQQISKKEIYKKIKASFVDEETVSNVDNEGKISEEEISKSLSEPVDFKDETVNQDVSEPEPVLKNETPKTAVALKEPEKKLEEQDSDKESKPKKEKNHVKLMSAAKVASEKTFPEKTKNNYDNDDDDEQDEYQEEKAFTSPSFDILTLGLVFLALLISLLLMYLTGLLSYSGKFLPNTYMNGINISKMTREEAEQAVLAQASSDAISITERSGNTITFNDEDYGCVVKLPDNAFDQAESENHTLWFSKLFNTTSYNTIIENTYSEDSLRQMILNYDWGTEPPTNAEIINNEDGSFGIKPETLGNSVNRDVLAEYVVEQLREGVTNVDMVQAGCYVLPEVISSDLQETVDTYNTINGVTITFDMTNREEIFDPVGTETIDYTTICNWVKVVDNKLLIDRDAAIDWVQTNIANRYDTYVDGYTRQFESTLDGVVQVDLTPTSIYGWETDIASTAQKLVDCIENRESCTIEPVYLQEGFRMRSDYEGYNYTGKTYVEVSITHQHLWYYVDGELFLETDCVTGMKDDPSRWTNPGIFYVWNKQSPAKLGTYAVEGYETWVTYWMPIDYIGIGLHDLYHYQYGGSVYTYEGSHGCINLPYNAVQQIYQQMVVGTPVVITA